MLKKIDITQLISLNYLSVRDLTKFQLHLSTIDFHRFNNIYLTIDL